MPTKENNSFLSPPKPHHHVFKLMMLILIFILIIVVTWAGSFVWDFIKTKTVVLDVSLKDNSLTDESRRSMMSQASGYTLQNPKMTDKQRLELMSKPGAKLLKLK